MSSEPQPAPIARRSNWLRLLLTGAPIVILVALITLFALTLGRDPSLVPSALIDRPAPQFTLPAVAGLTVPGFDRAALEGEVTLVNVFASWCIPCRDEHPVLTAIKQQSGVRLFGINLKDAPENATRFLAELGNPYDAVGADGGRVAIDWGVYGVPETFVVDANGTVAFKHVGPISPQAMTDEILPAIERARAVAR